MRRDPAPSPITGYAPGTLLPTRGAQADLYKTTRLGKPSGPFYTVKIYRASSELENNLGRAEAQILQSLAKGPKPAAGTPHWPVFVEQGVDNSTGRFWLIYEWIEGEDLDCLIRRTLSIDDRLAIAIACCDAAAAWHRHHLVHRDIKPQNIIVQRTDAGWHATLIDAGLALDTSEAQDNRARHSLAHMLFGTPGYRHNSLLDLKSAAAQEPDDIFALGATFYELFSGLRLVLDADLLAPPPDADPAAQLLHRERQFWRSPTHPSMRARLARAGAAGTPPRLSDDDHLNRADLRRLAGPLGEMLDLVLLKATHENRSWLYRKAGALGDDLRNLRNWMNTGQDVSGRDPSLPMLKALRDAPWGDDGAEPGAAGGEPGGWWRDGRLWKHAAYADLIRTHAALCKGAAALIEQRECRAAEDVLNCVEPHLQHTFEVGRLRLLADPCLFAILGHTAAVRSAAVSPDGTRIVTASGDQTARLWDAHTGAPLGEPMTHDGGVNSAAFSHDGTRIVTASDDCTARLWDAHTGAPLGEPMTHDGGVNSAAFSHDGTRIVTASDDQTAQLWDAHTGAPLGQTMTHDDWVRSAAFSHDGTRIVTASDDQTARLWDAHTGAPLGQTMTHDGGVNSAAFSHDGTRIVTASRDQTARLWDAHTGAPLGQTMTHDGGVNSAAFSHDGTRIVTASGDQTARLWDAHTGAPLGEPMTHDGGVNSAAFSHDGTRIVTASDDQTAQLWDAHTGAPLGQTMTHGGTVWSAAFSHDGTRIVTASNDRTARVWHSVPWLLRRHGPVTPPNAPPGFSATSRIEAFAHTWVLGLRARGLADPEITDRARRDPALSDHHRQAIHNYLGRFPRPPGA
ncbi:MAG: protein kinase [Phycisphaerales bacterium]|nr:protein kinase [Phycisphaerales bacterium]